MTPSEATRKPSFLQRRPADCARIVLLLAFIFLAIYPWPTPVFPAQTPPAGAATLNFQKIAPGLEHGQATRGVASKDDSTGPWYINALRIDLTLASIKIVRALDAGVGLETVSSLAARHGATAAINGGYFRTTGTYRGESLGIVLLDGRLISEPYNDRAGIGLLDEGKRSEILFGHLGYESEVVLGQGKRKVHGVNRPVGTDELIIFTPEFHRTTLTKPDGIEVVVRRNRIVSISDSAGSSEIPADGFVISALGESREWIKRNARRGSPAKVQWRVKSLYAAGDDRKWSKARNILGAGPQLIKAGRIEITDQREKMIAGFATTRHPRTALARLDSGKLLLITVDGRQPGISVGMSLQELAELLLELGARDAINLDGGGSTTMVVQNKVVNRPSDQGGERPVSDAILVLPNHNQE